MPKKKQIEKTKKLTDKQIDKYIDDIYSGAITVEKLSPEVYYSIVNHLKEALYEGYGQNFNALLEKGGKDFELLKELRENVYMFGAAKDYQMTKEISSLLVDPTTNEVRTLREFQDIARASYDNWNNNWGETEYSTAYGQGAAAIQWQRIEDEKDVLPTLEYSAIGDACDICEPLNGLTAAVDDPIWNEVAPLNHFNCRCILLQHDEDKKLSSDEHKEVVYDQVTNKMDDTFASNPGKDGMVFNEHHPYFDVAKKDREYARNNFDLPIPEKD